MKTLYVDMDGVLCNFEKRYHELFGKSPSDARDKKEFNPNWKHFIETKQFETLDWFPGAQELLKYIAQHKVHVEILSSAGGEKFHGEVSVQKIKWLRKHGINYKANIVTGRKKKKEYANSNSILIDDTDDVIDDFNAAGGVGILHRSFSETRKKLDELLDK